MRKLSSVFLLLLIIGCSSGKYDKTRKSFFGPPGTLWLKEHLFLDETEISNIDWEEYLYDLGTTYGSNSKEYKNALPDTNVWIKPEENNNPRLAKDYFRDIEYGLHPVVGITYKQAKEYCNWRTQKVKEAFDARRLKHPKKGFPENFFYRLPNKSEWEYAAGAGLDLEDYPHGFEQIINTRNVPKIVTKEFINYFRYYMGKDRFFSEYTTYGRPNKFGFFNLTGNVAEMVAEKGIAKGGSFEHNLEESQIIKDQKYIGPQRWLGFRCICEMNDFKELIEKEENQ